MGALRLRERLCYRVILTRKASDHHVDVRNLYFPSLILIKHSVNIFVHQLRIAKTLDITTSRELSLIRTGLPLICPHCAETTRRLHVKLRMLRIVIAIKAQPKTTDTREELGHLNLSRHVSPIATVSA